MSKETLLRDTKPLLCLFISRYIKILSNQLTGGTGVNHDKLHSIHCRNISKKRFKYLYLKRKERTEVKDAIHEAHPNAATQMQPAGIGRPVIW